MLTIHIPHPDCEVCDHIRARHLAERLELHAYLRHRTPAAVFDWCTGAEYVQVMDTQARLAASPDAPLPPTLAAQLAVEVHPGRVLGPDERALVRAAALEAIDAFMNWLRSPVDRAMYEELTATVVEEASDRPLPCLPPARAR